MLVQSNFHSLYLLAGHWRSHFPLLLPSTRPPFVFISAYEPTTLVLLWVEILGKEHLVKVIYVLGTEISAVKRALDEQFPFGMILCSLLAVALESVVPWM